MGILPQSKATNGWDAVAGAAGNYVTQFYERGGTVPEPGVNMSGYDDMNGSGGVMNQFDNVFVESVTGMKSLSFKGYPTKETLARHLISVFQKVTQAGSSPHAKQFTFADAVLDWANNAGYLHTVAFDTGVSGAGILLNNAILSEYSLTIDTTAKGTKRFCMHSGTWSGNAMLFDQTLSGTWTTPAKTLFNDSTNGFENGLVFNAGSGALSLPFYKFEFKYSAGLEADFVTTGGAAGNYIWAPKAQFIISVPYRSDTDAILGAYPAGTTSKVILLGNGLAGNADKNLQFSNTYGHLATNPYKVDKDYVALNIEINIETPTAGGAWGNIIQLTDTLDGGF
jgi:hypothetical protein